jgi:hypothetical protein
MPIAPHMTGPYSIVHRDIDASHVMAAAPSQATMAGQRAISFSCPHSQAALSKLLPIGISGLLLPSKPVSVSLYQGNLKLTHYQSSPHAGE